MLSQQTWRRGRPGPPALFRRVLRRQRGSAGVTGLILLTLALALGANTAVASVADALLIRAVPFPDPSRLVAVTTAFPGIRLTGMGLSGPEALELQELTSAFRAVGPYAFSGLPVQAGASAEQANAVELSEGAATALGLSAGEGRTFAAGEYANGGPPVVLLGHAFWRRAFGADNAIIGRAIRVGGVPRVVVGIAGEATTLLNRPVDLWLPLAIARGDAGSRADHRFNVVGRLADGHTLADAAADVRRAMDIWREETGELHTPSATMHPVELQSLARATTGLNREPIGALVAAVAFVLLIACANIANLLVARGERRRADVALQLALGASRKHLLADAVAEGIVLAATGSLGGLLIAQLLIDLVVAMWPVAANAGPLLDSRVLSATAVVTALAGTIIGLVPILRLDVARAHEWIKAGARGSVGGAGRMRVQKTLVAVQIALAVLLTGSAALMVRSFLALTAIETGIDAGQVLRAHIALPGGIDRDDAQVWGFYERMLERARVLPGVTGAAVMSGLPPLRRANNTSFLLDGTEMIDHSSIHQVDFVQHMSPGYLSILRIPVIEGRDLAPGDGERSPPVALVNDTLARRFWPGEHAIGHRLKPVGTGPWFLVVGVVADVRQAGVQAPPGAEIYVTHRQARLLLSGYLPRSMNVVLRTDSEERAIGTALRDEIARIDPAAAVSGLAPLQTVIDGTIAQPRLLAWMFVAFAVLALVVAGLGVYAVTAYAVGSRTSELGVRMALGARSVDAVRLVASGSAGAIGAGTIAGTAGAVLAARLLQSLLFGIDTLDLVSLATGALVIGVTACIGTLVPAYRATRIDPLTALREP